MWRYLCELNGDEAIHNDMNQKCTRIIVELQKKPSQK
jgi:hypothetical protein